MQPTGSENCRPSRRGRTPDPPTTSAEPPETQTPAPTTDETGASPEQFADHRPDRAQLTTWNNALAETTIGLYKTECIRADSPFRRGSLNTLRDVEYITADYVAWYNQQRLMHRLGRVPPAEAEAQYYSQHVTDQPAGSQNPEGA